MDPFHSLDNFQSQSASVSFCRSSRACSGPLLSRQIGCESVDGRSRYLYILLNGIHAHLMCTQCSILLHLLDVWFLLCICLSPISQIQTCLCVVVGS